MINLSLLHLKRASEPQNHLTFSYWLPEHQGTRECMKLAFTLIYTQEPATTYLIENGVIVALENVTWLMATQLGLINLKARTALSSYSWSHRNRYSS